MAAMTLSNHVLSGDTTDFIYPDWVCIDEIVWKTATAGHTLKITATEVAKIVLNTVQAGVNSATEDRHIRMHGKWAKGLVVTMGSGTIDFYLRQV